MTDNTVANRQRNKQWSTKHYTQKIRLSNTHPTETSSESCAPEGFSLSTLLKYTTLHNDYSTYFIECHTFYANYYCILQPNAGGRKWQELFHQRFRTNESHSFNGHSSLHANIFKGEHQLIIKQNGKTIHTETINVDQSQQTATIHLQGTGKISPPFTRLLFITLVLSYKDRYYRYSI